MAHYKKSSISDFLEIFVSTDKDFVTGGGINTRQQFY